MLDDFSDIASSLPRETSYRAFLMPAGTFSVWCNAEPRHSEVVFSLQCGQDFFFHAEVQAGRFVVQRGRHTLQVPLANDQPYPTLLSVVWDEELLVVRCGDGAGPRHAEVKVPIQPVPAKLMRWAKAKDILPRSEPFTSRSQVLREVKAILERLASKFEEAGGIWQVFWEKNDDGDLVPKDEPKLTEILHVLLADLEITKNLQIEPERKSGEGRIDFLFIGRLASGELAEVCVEFKKAHSVDLMHGFTVQLPTYMRHRNTEFGIYAILDFGAGYPPPGALREREEFNFAFLKGTLEGKPHHVVIPLFGQGSPSKRPAARQAR
jgi:hypothetical protein